MHDLKIDIAKDFSAYPIGRDAEDSVDSNGQKFREEFLVPALEAAEAANSTLEVSFEGVESFGSSFLEEAFGGLVRKNGWSEHQLRKILKITYDWRGYARMERRMWAHIADAKPEN